jgi:hypothetical protein
MLTIVDKYCNCPNLDASLPLNMVMFLLQYTANSGDMPEHLKSA